MKVEAAGPGRWKLVGLKPNQLDQLAHLPGLRIHPGAGAADGAKDAVVAALNRIGRDPADHFPIQSVMVPVNDYGHPLREYQKQGIATLLMRLRCDGGVLLADEMGLGKTRQAIVTALNLGPKTFVVCPASVRDTWGQELQAMGVPHAVWVPLSSSKKRLNAYANGRDAARFIVASYDAADDAFNDAFGKQTPTTVVMDEGHVLCGRGTQRVKRIQEIAALASFRIAITATPMWSRPRDYYSLLHILLGRRFGNRSEFVLAYCAGTPNEYGGLEDDGVSRPEELKARLQHYMVRRTKDQVAQELPPLTRQVHWVDATDEAAAVWRTMQIRRQMSGLHGALSTTLDGKVAAAVDLAVEAGKFLLFTWTRADAQKLGKAIQKRGVNCHVVTGTQTPAHRTEVVAKARNECAGVVATLDSLSVGVNLQGLATVGIFHALDWVPLKLLQAEARLHRLGTNAPIHWHYVAMRDSADELVISTVVDKLSQHAATLGALDINSGSNGSVAPTAGGLAGALLDSSLGAEEEAKLLAGLYEGL